MTLWVGEGVDRPRGERREAEEGEARAGRQKKGGGGQRVPAGPHLPPLAAAPGPPEGRWALDQTLRRANTRYAYTCSSATWGPTLTKGGGPTHKGRGRARFTHTHTRTHARMCLRSARPMPPSALRKSDTPRQRRDATPRDAHTRDPSADSFGALGSGGELCCTCRVRTACARAFSTALCNGRAILYISWRGGAAVTLLFCVH